jgi:hypothetical protein
MAEFRHEFALTVLPFTVEGVLAYLEALTLVEPIVDAEDVEGHSVAIIWANEPPSGDIDLVRDALAIYVEIGPTDEPLEVESLGITSATTSTLVTVIDATTPPRAAGTYQISWTALVGMLATVANTGVRGVITLTRTQGGVSVSRTWEHNHTLQQPQTFSGCITFLCQAGATLRAHLQVAKVGAPAATAQMAVARVTADKIG